MAEQRKKFEDLLLKQVDCQTIIANFTANTKSTPAAERTKTFYVIRLKRLEQVWLQYSNRHEELLAFKSIEPDNDYFASDQRTTVENQYVRSAVCHTEALEAIDKSKPTDASSTGNTSAHATNAVVLDVHSIIRASNEYARVQVPTFSGNHADWESFKERFQASIGKKDTFSDITKLEYLFEAVEGSAKRLLKGVRTVGSNYSVAWEKLCRRYDNPRKLWSTYFAELGALKPVKQRNAAELTDLLDSAEEAIQGLRDLDHFNGDGCDSYFVYAVYSKLDSKTREEWEVSQRGKTGFSSYKELALFLEERIREIDTANPSPAIVESKIDKNNVAKKPPKTHSSVHLVTSSGQKTKFECLCCKQSHALHACPQFNTLTVPKRLDFVKTNALCLNCLRKGHFLSQCTSKYSCAKCQKKHTKLHLVSTAQKTVIPEKFGNSSPES